MSQENKKNSFRKECIEEFNNCIQIKRAVKTAGKLSSFLKILCKGIFFLFSVPVRILSVILFSVIKLFDLLKKSFLSYSKRLKEGKIGGLFLLFDLLIILTTIIYACDNVHSYKTTAQEYFDRGCKFQQKGYDKTAIKEYKKAADLRYNNFDLWYNWGNALMKLGRYRESVKYYSKALTQSPSNFDALWNNGYCLSRLGLFKEAISNYDKALLSTNEMGLLVNKGICLNKLGLFDEAISAYDKAISIKSNDSAVLFSKGLIYERMNMCEKAISNYDRAIYFSNNYYKGWGGKGASLLFLKRYDEAYTSLTNASYLYSKNHIDKLEDFLVIEINALVAYLGKLTPIWESIASILLGFLGIIATILLTFIAIKSGVSRKEIKTIHRQMKAMSERLDKLNQKIS